MQNTKLEVVPSGAPVGAEIRGIDLSQPIDDATFGDIERAYARYGVLVFRDQHLTEREFVAVTERFGIPLETWPIIARIFAELDAIPAFADAAPPRQPDAA